ncbi:hypothetical protein F5Y04DRAFT_277181 [Hypomontagnella monticulosa]|nr:hypothetical protein F5Y04DRAFT_277181 [Hypomontagnella monticulosa]
MQPFFNYFKGAGDGSDIPHSPLDEAFVNLPGSWPSVRPSGSKQRLYAGGITDSSSAATDLNQQLREAEQKIQDLEHSLNSSAEAAEKIVTALLRDRNDLQNALERSNAEKESEAVKYRKLKETAQILFDELCGRKIGKKCDIRAHQGMAQRLEASVKLAAESVAKEEAQTKRADALAKQLIVVNNRMRDERCVSRLLSEQIEGMEGILKVQHNEMKEQKSLLDAQEPLIKILREENDRLQVFERTAPSYKDVGVGGGVVEIITLEAHARLEKKVIDTVEKSKRLRYELERERDMTWQFRARVDQLENRLVEERNKFEVQTAKLNRLAHALEATESAITRVLQRGDTLKGQLPLSPEDSYALLSQPSSSGHQEQPYTRGRNPRPRSPHPKKLRELQLLATNEEDEEDDDSPGPSTSAAAVSDSWLLNITEEEDEEIPELRLPSPVASVGRASRAEQRIEADPEGENEVSTATISEPSFENAEIEYRPERKTKSSMCGAYGSSER